MHTVDLRTDGPYNTYTRDRSAADADRTAVGRGDPRQRASGADRRIVFRGLRQTTTAATCSRRRCEQQNAAVARYLAQARRAAAGAARQ
jgi:hypothetical protein